MSSVPLWNELHAWLRLERTRVPDGGGIAAAIDSSLRRIGRSSRNDSTSCA